MGSEVVNRQELEVYSNIKNNVKNNVNNINNNRKGNEWIQRTNPTCWSVFFNTNNWPGESNWNAILFVACCTVKWQQQKSYAPSIVINDGLNIPIKRSSIRNLDRSSPPHISHTTKRFEERMDMSSILWSEKGRQIASWYDDGSPSWSKSEASIISESAYLAAFLMIVRIEPRIAYNDTEWTSEIRELLRFARLKKLPAGSTGWFSSCRYLPWSISRFPWGWSQSLPP